MTHICICTPSTGAHTSEMSTAKSALIAATVAAGHSLSFAAIDTAGIARSRNLHAQYALDAGADYVLWIDSDMTFPPDALLRLLAHNLPIVGCPYPMRTPPHALCGRPVPGHAHKQGGLAFMEFLPSGLMLVDCDVYRELPKPWYWESYAYEGTPAEQFKAVMRDAFEAEIYENDLENMAGELNQFLSMFNGEPHKRYGNTPLTLESSEDRNFCRKARRAGFTVYGDLDLMRELGHVGKATFTVGGAV